MVSIEQTATLMQPVLCVTEQHLQAGCTEHTRDAACTAQIVLYLQFTVPNTITTENILNTQCTMRFCSTCQSLNTSCYLPKFALIKKLHTLYTHSDPSERHLQPASTHSTTSHPSALSVTHVTVPSFLPTVCPLQCLVECVVVNCNIYSLYPLNCKIV